MSESAKRLKEAHMSMSTSVPNPMILARQAEARLQVASLTADERAKTVRPGFADKTEVHIHDGVLKTKQLKPGMAVRAWLHGKPCGSEKVVESVTRIEDGAFWEITFSSAHVPETRPAAYRWYCEALDGAPVEHVTKVRALVAYEEA